MEVIEYETCTQHLCKILPATKHSLVMPSPSETTAGWLFPTTRGVAFCYVHLARKQDPRDYQP